MTGPRADWLLTTINAVRERMIERLQKRSLDEETEREVQMALEEIEVMWEELVGQAEILEREHDRYQQFFEHAPEAYAVTDEGCNIREANRSFAELLGVLRADLLGRPLSAFVPDEERGLFLTKFVGGVQQAAGKPLTWRSRLQPREGEPIEGFFSVRAIPLRKSGLAGLCWLFRPL
jgi:PAS domain S-box-containing protein